MKLARQLERRLEDALDHLAGRIFRGGLHLSELAARIAREAELAADRGWRLEGPVTVALDRSEEVAVGTIASSASIAPGTLPCWAQLTSPNGEKTPIRHNRAVIGRSDDADVVLGYPEISRTHALIYRQGGEIYVVDPGSANGTQVDGTAVGRTPTRIAAVAELTLANRHFRFTPCRS